MGPRPTTPDGSPVLGPVPGVESAFLATGRGQTGLQLGPYGREVVAEPVLGRKGGIPPEFRPERFDRGAIVARRQRINRSRESVSA